MPELPEVETVRRGLEPALKGARLSRVRQNRPDLRFPFPHRFVERLDGAVVERLERRAKYLLFPLSTGETWVTHLGMTGRFTLDGAQIGEFEEDAPATGKHEHMSLCATVDGVTHRIGFADARRFGFMGLIPSDQVDEHPWFKGLGPEPLGNAFSAAHLAEAFAGKKQNIKVSLLDQRIVSGLGNIYVCEALYRARISPLTAAGKVSRAHRGGRLDAARFRQRRGRPGLFPAPLRRLWLRGRTVPGRRLHGQGQAHRPGRPLDLLLPQLPEAVGSRTGSREWGSGSHTLPFPAPCSLFPR